MNKSNNPINQSNNSTKKFGVTNIKRRSFTMESLKQMDLEDWEILPDEGFLEIHDIGAHNLNPQDHEVMAMVSDRVIKSLDDGDDDEADDDSSDQLHDPTMVKRADHNQSVDKKVVESPESKSTTGIMPSQIKAFHLEEAMKGPLEEDEPDTEMVININNHKKNDGDGGGMNIWKRSLTGIGAVCSFGLAAATICIIICSSHRNSKQLQQNQFQIYGSDKRINQVVHYASKLNETITGLRGVPVTVAHVTVGGYCDASV